MNRIENLEPQRALVERTSQAVLANYQRFPLALSRGEGSFVFDADGKRYLDLFVGFGAGGIAGHCHPQITTAIKNQADLLLSHGNVYTSEPQIEAAELLIRRSFPARVFFCHSGTEANEAALKLVRKAAGKDRFKIISFENCFHGRTMGGLSLSPRVFQEGFEPMLEGNVMLPFGDLDAVRNAIDSETAGIFFEPIQGEGGMNIPEAAFVQGLRALCDEHRLLLVADEVWTAPARTGRWYGYEHFGVQPDLVTLAKALGGGVPFGACIIAEQYSGFLSPGTHGCTTGGNPLCAAAAVAALKLVEEQQLDKRAERLGARVITQLKQHAAKSVVDIRGKGLMIGIEIAAERQVRDIQIAAQAEGLLIGTAKHNVLRLAPALTIEEPLLDQGIEMVCALLDRG